ncbi:hypothetical protein GCM10011385_04930 [Nitratireductor aestuarii]|uniref:Uncharacterized protein n=1 Tax=Nitratireductor aestuarii TaxID=1735103 RepID=A0A916RFQ2_9HYPH|nr:hypothetical protein [Nitratireductor aestuarii]GGA54365.1 hypothetical protein GCM10011385_04930 [Nitratireductor aestuarii]
MLCWSGELKSGGAIQCLSRAPRNDECTAVLGQTGTAAEAGGRIMLAPQAEWRLGISRFRHRHKEPSIGRIAITDGV